MVTESNLYINGGYHSTQKWDESLIFDRYGWYHELTLLYDVLLTKLDKSDPFYSWLTIREKALLESCSESYVGMSYTLDSERISHRMFLAEMEKYGFEEIILPNFAKAMKLHPDTEKLSLQVYKHFALCKERGGDKFSEKVLVNFPSFESQEIK